MAAAGGGEGIRMGRVESFYDQNPQYKWDRQGAVPNGPVVGEGLNSVPYGYVRDADSLGGQEQGGSAQAQALSVGGQPERDGPGGSPFSLDHAVFPEELPQLVEGHRHRHPLPSSLHHLAFLNGAEPVEVYQKIPFIGWQS